MTQDRLRNALRALAVVALLVVGARCAYLEHRLAAVTNAANASKAQAPGEPAPRPDGPPPGTAVGTSDEGTGAVGRGPNDASRPISRIGPSFSSVPPPSRPAPIHQAGPGVFTNRDPDPAETPSR